MSRLAPMGPTRRIGQLVLRYEKITLALLAVVIALSGSIWFRQYSKNQGDQPVAGGTYVQGIVGGQKEVEAIAAELTRTGLFQISKTGDVVNQLTTSWQLNDQKNEYQFTLKDKIDPVQIKADYEENLSFLGQAVVEVKSPNQLSVHLSEPNPDLPLLLSEPLFRYGPYKVSKTTDKTTIFTRDIRHQAAPAYINKIVLHNFGSQKELDDNLKAGKIDGATTTADQSAPKNFHNLTFPLPRYYAVILNINKSPFRDDAIRHNLFAGQNAASIGSFSLFRTAEEPFHTYAQAIVQKWQSQGIKVTLIEKPLQEVSQKIGLSRDFQALLTGINQGPELDPFYLWHSSQIRPPGNNISGIKSDKIDAILGQIRSTTNVSTRQQLVTTLHQTLTDTGVALFLDQETGSVTVSDNIRFQRPWLPTSTDDFWQAVPQWSVK